MEKKLTNPELKEIAYQLSCPNGQQGIEIAKKMNDTNIGMTTETIKALNINNSNTILEFGHGNCGHLELLLNQANNIRFFGLEISETMQKEAKQINRQLLTDNQVEFKLYDGQHIPFESQFFDRIMTVNTIYFWEDPTKMFKEIYRVLKPNGIFVLTFAQKHFMAKLPFVKHKFKLYDNKEVCTIAINSNFVQLSVIEKTEKVKDKTDEWVNRQFSVVKMEKE